MKNKDRILVVDVAYLTSEMTDYTTHDLVSKLEDKYGEKVLLIDSFRSNGAVQNHPPVFFASQDKEQVEILEQSTAEDDVKEKLIKLLEENAHKLAEVSKSVISTTYVLYDNGLKVKLSSENISFNDEDYPIEREVYDSILRKAKEYRIRQLDFLIAADKK